MKKLLNNPNDFVLEMLDGLLKAYPSMLSYTNDDVHCIVRAGAPVTGKVALATGGGAGHLPVFLGYVGKGMLDGCAVGDVFASPNAEQMVAVTRQIDGEKGVVYIYGNYGGDVMNFDMAAEMADMEGITVKTVLVKDDVSSSPPEKAHLRRGVAGMVFAFKIAGAKADCGSSIEEVVAVTEKALSNIRTIGIGLSPCTVPMAGTPTFTIAEDEMEIGMGIHGERGKAREKMQSSDLIAERMTEMLLADLLPEDYARLAVMVNGLGATPPEELYILYRKVNSILIEKGFSIHKAFIGEYATSMEMAGASITLFKLDDELSELLDMPANTPFFKQF